MTEEKIQSTENMSTATEVPVKEEPQLLPPNHGTGGRFIAVGDGFVVRAPD